MATINLVEESVKAAVKEALDDEKKQTFGKETTAIEAAGNVDLSGKVVVITGCNTGIGKETVRVLALKGAKVYMLCRNMDKANKAKADIEEELKKENVSAELITMSLDLNSLKAVKESAEKFIALNEKIDFLINNAGIMALPKFTASADGFERQFAVNHLAHYYLTMLLLPILVKSKSRIISLSSRGHMAAPEGNAWIDELIKAKSGPSEKEYGTFGLLEYGKTKMANLLFAQTLQRKYGSLGITSVSLHPGDIQTQLWQHMDLEKLPELAKALPKIAAVLTDKECIVQKTTEQGAATTVRCVALSNDEIEGGAFYVDCNPCDLNRLREDVKPPKSIAAGDKLFELSELLLAQKGFSYGPSKDRVVLITGASKGFGFAMAQSLSALGYKVYGGSRSEPKNKYDFKFVALDVTKEDSIKAAVEQIVKAEGTIDVLINNAGYFQPMSSVQSVKMEDHRRMLEINYLGYIGMTNAVLPIFFKNKNKTGHIINVTSCISTIGNPWAASYCATKSAIDRITEGYNIELMAAGANVTVQLLAPGYCPATSLFDDLTKNVDAEIEEYKAAFSAYLKRMMSGNATSNAISIEDVVNACNRMVNKDVSALDFRVYAGVGSRKEAEFYHTGFNLNFSHNVNAGKISAGLVKGKSQ